MMWGRLWLAIPAVVYCLTGCARGDTSVARVVDGQLVQGRYITSAGYYLYARGVYHEARQEWDQAQAAYETALDEDPNSPELWTRLGALACRSSIRNAEAAFRSALLSDSNYQPTHLARARCALRHDKPKRALVSVRKALALDPANLDAALVIAAIHERLGDHASAERWLVAVTTRTPQYTKGWQALADFAKRRRRPLLAARAAASQSTPRHKVGKPKATGKQLRGVDQALANNDLRAAERAAIKARMSTSTLAVRAAAVGRARIAHEIGSLALAADPSDSNARIAVAVAASLDGNPERLNASMRNLDTEPQALSSLSARLLADLLARRVGVEAARRWLAAQPQLPPPADAVERSIAQRIAAWRTDSDQ